MKENEVNFEIRQMLNFNRREDPVDYSILKANHRDVIGDLKFRISYVTRSLLEVFAEKKLKFEIVGSSEVNEHIRLRGPEAEAAKVLSQIRKCFITDSNDLIRYRHLEIVQTGPGEGEWKIFGPKGPPKSESHPISEPKLPTVKEPMFDAEGEDASTYAPFLLKNLLDNPEPEVRLEFADFDLLNDTLGADHDLEGNTLGDVMIEIIDKKKLVKDHEGTHPGGYFDNCEGSTVLFHFNTLRDAIRVAEYFIKVFKSKKLLKGIFKSYGIDLNGDA